MHLRYTAFDFDIRSEMPLPARRLAHGLPNLAVVSVVYDAALADSPWSGCDFSMSRYLEFAVIGDEEWMLRSFDSASGREARLAINAGGTIRACCRGGYLQGDLGRLVVYQGLTALALLRGSAALHGSMFRHDGRGFAVLGHSGQGKSTTTVALLQAGAGLVAEETLVLSDVGGEWCVLGGLPHLSLDRALIGRLEERETLPEWEREYAGVEEKTRWRWHSEDSEQEPLQPAPLQAVFVLRSREPGQSTWQHRRLNMPAAVQELSQHCQWASQLPPSYRASSYRAAMRIAASMPVYRLSLPDSLDLLFAQAPEILRGLCELTPCEVKAYG